MWGKGILCVSIIDLGGINCTNLTLEMTATAQTVFEEVASIFSAHTWTMFPHLWTRLVQI